jgi:hypothetical protein
MLRSFLLAFVFQGRERCVDFLGQIAGSGLRASVGRRFTAAWTVLFGLFSQNLKSLHKTLQWALTRAVCCVCRVA